MKKLIIVAVAVAVCSAAKATSYQWNYSTTGTAKALFETAAADKDKTVAGTLYVLWGISSTANANTAKDNLITQLRTLTSGWDTAITGNANYLDNFANEDNKGSKVLTAGQIPTPVEFTEDVSSGVTKYAFAVILAQDKAGKEWAYISATANSSGGEVGDLKVGTLGFNVGATGVYNLDATQTGKQSGWYQLNTAAVPEPTSGLLLLLGMAGLALRRRRA